MLFDIQRDVQPDLVNLVEDAHPAQDFFHQRVDFLGREYIVKR